MTQIHITSDDEELNDIDSMKEYLKDELEDIIENL